MGSSDAAAVMGDLIAYEDIRDVTAAKLMADIGRLPSVIVGSPPCQDASCANTSGRGVDGERTGLFFEAIRLVGECRPVWCCFENVPGLRTRGADRVLAALEALGYTCWPLVVGAWHAGAPHRRNRVWIVAADLSGDGWGQGRPGRPNPGDPGERERALQGAVAADANSNALREQPGRGSRPDGAGSGKPQHIAGTDRQGQHGADAVGEGERGVACPELPPAIRAVAEGSDWNGGAVGLARSLRVADGIPGRMARLGIASFGDAVVPAITEAIARSMMQLLPTDGTVLDLFAGAAGGWSLGMHRAGYRTVAFCEIDPWRRAAFSRHWDRPHATD